MSFTIGKVIEEHQKSNKNLKKIHKAKVQALKDQHYKEKQKIINKAASDIAD